jgi:hypothetical protein
MFFITQEPNLHYCTCKVLQMAENQQTLRKFSHMKIKAYTCRSNYCTKAHKFETESPGTNATVPAATEHCQCHPQYRTS